MHTTHEQTHTHIYGSIYTLRNSKALKSRGWGHMDILKINVGTKLEYVR